MNKSLQLLVLQVDLHFIYKIISYVLVEYALSLAVQVRKIMKTMNQQS